MPEPQKLSAPSLDADGNVRADAATKAVQEFAAAENRNFAINVIYLVLAAGTAFVAAAAARRR